MSGRPDAHSQNPLAIAGARTYLHRMLFRPLLCALLACGLAGCETPYKKAEKKEKEPLRNTSNDQSFQAFVGRLRIAVANKDLPMITSMMTPDFGYRFDAPPAAENVFTYWDEQGSWPVLQGLLREKFTANDLYMVSPPQVASDPAYNGPRCGMRVIGGSWKFAYFLPTGE